MRHKIIIRKRNIRTHTSLRQGWRIGIIIGKYQWIAGRRRHHNHKAGTIHPHTPQTIIRIINSLWSGSSIRINPSKGINNRIAIKSISAIDSIILTKQLKRCIRSQILCLWLGETWHRWGINRKILGSRITAAIQSIRNSMHPRPRTLKTKLVATHPRPTKGTSCWTCG